MVAGDCEPRGGGEDWLPEAGPRVPSLLICGFSCLVVVAVDSLNGVTLRAEGSKREGENCVLHAIVVPLDHSMAGKLGSL